MCTLQTDKPEERLFFHVDIVLGRQAIRRCAYDRASLGFLREQEMQFPGKTGITFSGGSREFLENIVCVCVNIYFWRWWCCATEMLSG
jgi:hypothetical protein